MKKIFAILMFALCFSWVYSQEDPATKGLEAITTEAVQGQLEFLSSDWTEGRQTGTKGEFIAGDYIASIFKIYGLAPAGDYRFTELTREERWEGKKPEKYRSFFQEFSLIKSKAGKEQHLSVTKKNKNGESTFHFTYKTDFEFGSLPPVSMSGAAPVVFVGYGYVNEKEGYNDYQGVDVSGKIIIRLAGFPGINDTASEAFRKFHPEGRYGYYYLNRDKNKEARERGAIAVIEPGYEGIQKDWTVNLPFRFKSAIYEGPEELESPYEYDFSLPEDTLKTNPLIIRVTPAIMNLLLDGSGIHPDEFHKSIAARPKPMSKEIFGKQAGFVTTMESEIVTARNVIGMIEGKNPDSLIVLGAHYDHLGIHDGYIWNGADDNASGTVGVMTIARAFLATGEQPERTIVFAAWTGEEMGLLGSSYFVDHPVKPVENILLNLNFDMISRDSRNDTLKNKCSLSYSKSHPILEEISKKNNETHELGLDIGFRASEGGRGGSDHAPFSMKGIPFAFFMAGFTTDYHQPTDEIEKVNIDKMTRIVKLGFLNAWKLDKVNLSRNKPKQ
ncbi:MAG: M20/M25/M40 family metallo-hydrolase [Bacteroidetes bacterium]|nr:M20/M25/M40 family metallo-hydrolase [Bacteroidota bacterium]